MTRWPAFHAELTGIQPLPEASGASAPSEPQSPAGEGEPFCLPYPPTTNNLFFNAGKRRVRSKGYDAWIAEGAAMIAQQKPAKVSGPYVLMIRADRPDRRARDLGNIEKPVSDLLVKCGVIRDDSDAKAILLTWTDASPARPATVAVSVMGV